jgi:hypothetical protein
LPEQVVNTQIRFVISKEVYYYYDSSSGLTSDGDNVIQPIRVSGRWLKSTIDVRDGTISFVKLDTDLQNRLSKLTNIEYLTFNTPRTETLELSNFQNDYFIITTPVEDGNFTPFIFDFTYADLGNSLSREFVVEFRYRDSVFRFADFINFPNNDTPLPSGNNNSDIFVFQYQVSNTGIITKRGFLYAQNV